MIIAFNTGFHAKIMTLFCSQDRTKAVEILVKDLKVFSAFNEDLYKEITQLLTLDNFRHVCFFLTLLPPK